MLCHLDNEVCERGDTMTQNATRETKRRSSSTRVRIGPISLFTLVIVVCLSVLAVLAASTANATYAMSERMGIATQDYYLDDAAGQVLVAGIDGALEDVRATGGDRDAAVRAVESALPDICEKARERAGGDADVTASCEEGRVNAEITCHNGRMLKVTVAVLDDATYRIDRWKMTAVENEEQPTGNLWTGA